MLYTLKDLADFCWQHKGKAFPGNDYKEVCQKIISASRRGWLHNVEDDEGLCAVIIVSERHGTNTWYVHEIVCVRNGFRTLIKEAFNRQPDFTVSGLRSNKKTIYQRRNLWAVETAPKT